MTHIATKRERKERVRIYLDYAAGAPVRPEVSARISELLEMYANPSSIHTEGASVRILLEEARARAARVLGGRPDEIHFTSGSTEGLNIAIQGILLASKEIGEIPHVITSTIEHPAILETLKFLEKKGIEVEYLNPGKRGIVSLDDVRKTLKPQTTLIVLSLINSEIGTISPTKELRVLKKGETQKTKPYIVIDATQAPLFYKLDVNALRADALVLDGAKIGGLKGSGLLYVRRGVEIAPILFGGGQEKGLRPGTQNILAIDSLVTALEFSAREVREMRARLQELSSFFIKRIQEEIPGISINGDPENSAPHIVSVCFPGIDAEWLVLALDASGVSVSRGSACKSGKGNESEVLRSINPECKENSIRFSFGRETTQEELERAILLLKKYVATGADSQ